MIESKVALVTGATRGIGRAILNKMLEQGYTVVGTATTQEGAESIEMAVQQAGGRGAGLCLDIADQSQIETLLATMTARFSAPSILVNNAGITRDNLLLRMQQEQWDAVMATNLRGVFQLTQACVRPMIKQRWGRIISIGSVVGAMGNPGQANYAAAKAGMVGLMKSLSVEIARRGVTVNVVAPGFVQTDMTAQLNEKQQQAIISQVPMGKMGQPEDIADAVAYLASEGAGYVTGQTLHVNGGMLRI